MCTAVIDMCQPPGQDERMGGWTINWKYCIMIGLSFCLEEVCKPKHVREPEKKIIFAIYVGAPIPNSIRPFKNQPTMIHISLIP